MLRVQYNYRYSPASFLLLMTQNLYRRFGFLHMLLWPFIMILGLATYHFLPLQLPCRRLLFVNLRGTWRNFFCTRFGFLQFHLAASTMTISSEMKLPLCGVWFWFFAFAIFWMLSEAFISLPLPFIFELIKSHCQTFGNRMAHSPSSNLPLQNVQ